MDRPASVAELTDLLKGGGYLADRGLATALFVSLSLGRPILVEGEVGVGKTEVAKVLASVFDRRLIRLQCYEGIDTNQALYEWDYARQMLQIRALSERQLADDELTEGAVDKLFGPKFLLERPLLDAVRAGDRAVLLIDEIDRADDEFEAFLLEVLSDFQITIPEIGTIEAATRPMVVLTSNRTRELHDALWEADADTRVHAVAISGAGDGFSAGYDLGGRMEIGAGDADARYRDGRTIDDDSWILERLQSLRMAIFDDA
jgi:MoxR-like ATPase